jgi:hypothetical protein
VKAKPKKRGRPPCRCPCKCCRTIHKTEAARNRELYQLRADLGACVACGKKQAALGRKQCLDCLEAKRQRIREKRREDADTIKRETG